MGTATFMMNKRAKDKYSEVTEVVQLRMLALGHTPETPPSMVYRIVRCRGCRERFALGRLGDLVSADNHMVAGVCPQASGYKLRKLVTG